MKEFGHVKKLVRKALLAGVKHAAELVSRQRMRHRAALWCARQLPKDRSLQYMWYGEGGSG